MNADKTGVLIRVYLRSSAAPHPFTLFQRSDGAAAPRPTNCYEAGKMQATGGTALRHHEANRWLAPAGGYGLMSPDTFNFFSMRAI